jgi:hypothetical protein
LEGSSLSGRGVSSQLAWDPTRTLDGDDDVVVIGEEGEVRNTSVASARDDGDGKKSKTNLFFPKK